jgi:hypothetical protein
MTQRRILATQLRIEQTIETAQRKGLTPSSVEMHPDGRVVIHLGVTANATPKERKRPEGWGL